MRRTTFFVSIIVTLLMLVGPSAFALVDTRLVFVSNTYNSPGAGQGTLVLDVEARSMSGSPETIETFQDAFQLDAALRTQYVSIAFSNQLFPSSSYTTTEGYRSSDGRVRCVYTYSTGSRSTIGTSFTQVVRVTIVYNTTASTTTIGWYAGYPDYYVTNSASSVITGSEGAIPSSLTNVALPVELVSFTAAAHHLKVELHWITATEISNYGFEIERAIANSSSSTGLFEWAKIGFMEGHGNSNSRKEYSFVDNSISVSATYSYRLKQIDRDGSFKYYQAVEVTIDKPSKYELAQGYPNPFNPTTTIEFSLPQSGYVTLKIYSTVGEEVATLVSEKRSAGRYRVEWNASGFASGVYFCRLQAGQFVQTKKLVVLM
jgi:hypothetical protein